MDESNFINPDCELCNLCQSRTQVVQSRGSDKARIMIVAEAPGQAEDEVGIPLIGISGQMLEKILQSIGLSSQECYITNTVRCRPPDNRKPMAKEVKACLPYLDAEIERIKPEYIIVMGNTSYHTLTGDRQTITKVVGQFIECDGYTVLPIFHPAYLIRQNGKDVGSPKWKVWQAMIELWQRLNA